MAEYNYLSCVENTEPPAGVSLESFPLENPRLGQLRIQMKLAPINPADINMIQGVYGIRPDIPFPLGNEGFGIVHAIGEGVEGFRIGQKVLPLTTQAGTWSEYLSIDARKCIRIDSRLPDDVAAMLRVNPPTAWRMLRDYTSREPGDYVIQNASNSIVGRCVIQFAKSLDLKTINLVRRPELIDELKELGADEVILEDEFSPKELKKITGGNLPRLALNAVGGQSAMLLMKGLATGGYMITYGAMGKKPFQLGGGALIFKDLRFQGFWITRWVKEASRADIQEMFDEIITAALEVDLKLPVAGRYPINEFTAALTLAGEDKRSGKVLFDLSES